MKQLTRTICVVLFSTAYVSLNAQTDQQAMMKAWNEFMTPGQIHQMMAKDDGEWKTEISLWMEPGGAPATSTGKCVNKMIMGGRYQQSEFSGDFMGMPMEGLSTLGYDNAKKVFVSSWIDNMGTGLMLMEGKWDEGSKTIHFTGNQTDPMTGKDMPIRETFKYIDNNTQLMEMYSTHDGKEHKMMEIKFTRL